MEEMIDRILKERLNQYQVPIEIQNEIRKELMSAMSRPEKQKKGCTIMTPSASMAADLARKSGKPQVGGEKPQVL